MTGAIVTAITACIAVSVVRFEPSQFADIDRRSIAVANFDSVESLSKQLTTNCKTELHRVRSIWRWITYHIDYDIESFRSGYRVPVAPESTIARRKTVCTGYSRLFERLCAIAGIRTARIRGFIKGWGYLPESQDKRFRLNHEWNAVYIAGKWYIVDCCWGAGYIDKNAGFVKQYTEHFFCVAPELMIRTHFPEDPKWQMLERPVSFDEYLSQPRLYPDEVRGFEVQ